MTLEILRMVPDDRSFVVPKSYKQPLKSYLKQCGCLVTNRKYLIASFKTRIHIWKLDETNILASINTNHQLIGQLELRKNILGKMVLLILFGYSLLFCNICYLVSSGCEKVVKVWCLESMACLHSLSYVDRS